VWVADGFYRIESQDGTGWIPGKASDFDLLNPKKQIEEINIEAKRRHETEEKERAIKLAEQKAQQETLIKEVTDALAEKLNSLSGLDTVAFSSMQKEIERPAEAEVDGRSSGSC
jgi:phenylpyruvate tautomerase PptA (4-oxalocrotonate tautomerase family)